MSLFLLSDALREQTYRVLRDAAASISNLRLTNMSAHHRSRGHLTTRLGWRRRRLHDLYRMTDQLMFQDNDRRRKSISSLVN